MNKWILTLGTVLLGTVALAQSGPNPGPAPSTPMGPFPVEVGQAKRGYAVHAQIVNGTAHVICNDDPFTRCVKVHDGLTSSGLMTVDVYAKDGKVLATYEFESGTGNEEETQTTIDFFKARKL